MSSRTPPERGSDRPAARARNPVGSHVPVAGGLAAKGLAHARKIGAEAVQVFVANARGWATPPGDPAQDEEFRNRCAEDGIPVYVHAPYLINLGSHTPATAANSVTSLRHSLRRGRAIGARGVVVHTGSATGGRPRETALAQVRELTLPLLDELGDDPDAPELLLEPTAGQGFSLCSRLPELGAYLDLLDRHPRLGVCLDTCHVFAAGHDLAASGGAKQVLDELVEVAGPGRLRLLHANDSKAAVGSCLDRHENIGAGQIGAEAFRELIRHPAMAGVPLIIETPGGGPEGPKAAADIALLKELREPAGP
ncbi:deoxyribonuclease IV [Streptomyces sp. CMB-StM0423]|uniref:deoxyribonuclease IV n=1 Tax=Streptomyces sp. CMB-StM0423 TaxID=2059884 RepID=UPI000C7049FE|nr:deoxyribonuclease IV [Streptomyces sp. CMB-StM0423]AUH43490.1 endonuclease IV [Streptomyces sp. CMB-StM0423]